MSSERNITEELDNNNIAGDSVQSENSDQQNENSNHKEPQNESSDSEEKKTDEAAEPRPKGESVASEAGENHGDEEDHEEDDHEHESESLEIHKLAKPELLSHLEELKDWSDIKAADKRANALKARLDEIIDTERSDALEKFIEEGGEEDAFQFTLDKTTIKFEATFKFLKDKKRKFQHEMEASREQNHQIALKTLEKLRQFVDSDESSSSFNSFKEIQQEWRSIGPLPKSQVKNLWANYNALVNLFYDKRSIYFELKELDRKKNLEAKLELCERAEQLLKEGDLKKAIIDLNVLHEEFKHVGPVPLEEQEELWKRFKAASDEIYSRRKEYYHNFKAKQKENLSLKESLIEQVRKFGDFDSGSIKEWNQKTKELLEFQKKWEAVGGVPKEHSKEINKQFWTLFKGFFKNKNNFFKNLESQREDNLKAKEGLVEKVKQLIKGDNQEKIADEIKSLQKKWKDIGPVPEKKRQEVFKKFKAVCDEFFQQRREHQKEEQKQYEENLDRKKSIIEEINSMAKEKSSDLNKLEELKSAFNQAGFVPRNAINSTRKAFSKAVESFISNANIEESQKEEILIEAEVSQLQNDPNSGKKLQQKEYNLRKQIGQIEEEINRMKTNLEFFADSKNAQVFKDQFREKIETASDELFRLKKQLKILRSARQ